MHSRIHQVDGQQAYFDFSVQQNKVPQPFSYRNSSCEKENDLGLQVG